MPAGMREFLDLCQKKHCMNDTTLLQVVTDYTFKDSITHMPEWHI